MDERKRDGSGRLPPASDEFTRAILAGADDIYRYQRKRRRRALLSLGVAAALLLAVGVGAALGRLRAPRPDNVVTAVDPDSAIPDGSGEGTARPDASPGPDASRAEKARPEAQSVPPEETLRTPEATPSVNEAGLEVLTDAGPFEAGEWLVLTQADGSLAYGNGIEFFEKPSQMSRSVEGYVGMLVKYLGDAEEGFSHVEFCGQPGYVYTQWLRRGAPLPTLDPNKRYTVHSAALFLTDNLGESHAQYIYDSDTLAAYALQGLLEALEPDPDPPEGGELADMAIDMLLVVALQEEGRTSLDATENGADATLRLHLSREGDFRLMAEDGSWYVASDTYERVFTTIFSELWEWCYSVGK